MNPHNTGHDMYLPDRRAKRTKEPRAVAGEIIPDPYGTQEQREAWMRQRQATMPPALRCIGKRRGRPPKRRELPRDSPIAALTRRFISQGLPPSMPEGDTIENQEPDECR